MSNGWDKKRKKVKKDLEDEAEFEEDSDHPIHEKYTEEGKFVKEDEEDEKED